MSTPDRNSTEKRSTLRSHSSYDSGLFSGSYAGAGVPLQCQFCPGQDFRRSSLRAQDLSDLLLMRYPVRCLRCSQRQLVSFTVAGISVPSHVKQRRARSLVAEHKNWSEPGKEPGSHSTRDGRADEGNQVRSPGAEVNTSE